MHPINKKTERMCVHLPEQAQGRPLNLLRALVPRLGWAGGLSDWRAL